jgi:hypothetical protein
MSGICPILTLVAGFKRAFGLEAAARGTNGPPVGCVGLICPSSIICKTLPLNIMGSVRKSSLPASFENVSTHSNAMQSVNLQQHRRVRL